MNNDAKRLLPKARTPFKMLWIAIELYAIRQLDIQRQQERTARWCR